MYAVSTEESSRLLKLPVETLSAILDRLTPFHIVGLLYSCGSTLFNRRLKQCTTSWYDTSHNIFLNWVEFARTSNLVSFTLDNAHNSGALLPFYVRSLPPTLRYLKVRYSNVDELFWLDDNEEDECGLHDALVPSHTYTSGAKPWLVRKSFPLLTTLLVSGPKSVSTGDATFVAPFLAGLPSTLAELSLPIFHACVIDIFQLLPPNITKLHPIGNQFANCYPTARHSLESLESLELFISEIEMPHPGTKRWAAATRLSELVFPPSLTHLKLCMAVIYPRTALPHYPVTLQSLVLHCWKPESFSLPHEIFRLVPPTVTFLRCEEVPFHASERMTDCLDTLPTLPHLKHFHFECYFPNSAHPKDEDEDILWRAVIQLMPAVEAFSLTVADSRPTLGLQHLVLFNNSILRTLDCELKMQENAPIDDLETKVRRILPNTLIQWPRFFPRSLQSKTLDLRDADSGFAWKSVTPSNFPHLETLIVSTEDYSNVDISSLTTLTDLELTKVSFQICEPLDFACPPQLTRLALPNYVDIESTFYPLPATLTFLRCDNPSPSEVAKCVSLQTLIVTSSGGSKWLKSHFPASLTYLRLPSRVWESLAEDSSLNSLCLHLPNLRAIKAKPISSSILELVRGLPHHIIADVKLLDALRSPSTLASHAGLSRGEITLWPNETISDCMTRWVVLKAYKNIRPIRFVYTDVTNDELGRFLPYLSSSTTELSLSQLAMICRRLPWPSRLTKLVITGLNLSCAEDEIFHFPTTLNTLIIHSMLPHNCPRLDAFLPKGLTRLEFWDAPFDYVVQWPPALRRLTASFSSDCIAENLKAMPSSLSYLVLTRTFDVQHFESLPTSLKCLECAVPLKVDLRFAEMTRDRGIVWINRQPFAKNDYSHFNFDDALDHLIAITLQK